MEKSLTNECPYCTGTLRVARMVCGQCGVAIEGEFAPSRLGRLPFDHQRFIEMFILASGNLKVVATETGVSYPTVRSRLNKVIDTLRAEIGQTVETTGTILDAVAEVVQDPANGGDPAHAVDPDAAGQLIKRI